MSGTMNGGDSGVCGSTPPSKEPITRKHSRACEATYAVAEGTYDCDGECQEPLMTDKASEPITPEELARIEAGDWDGAIPRLIAEIKRLRGEVEDLVWEKAGFNPDDFREPR